MSSVADFYLDEDALEEGVKLPLLDRHDKPTGEYLRVLYMHSDKVQAAIAKEYKRIFADGEYDADKPLDGGELTRKIRHVLVAGWSFQEECTPEAVKELFKRNPAIANSVMYKAENKRLFFPDAGGSSSNGPKKKSS